MAHVIEGHHPERGRLFAAVDSGARYVHSALAGLRFAALLTPYRSADEAEAALVAAGAELKEKRNDG